MTNTDLIQSVDVSVPPGLHGRRQIFTSQEIITAENVVEQLQYALGVHLLNASEEEYLYWYRRGSMPILDRTKEVRPEILNIVVENHAEEIVTFKNGYFLTQPAFYVSRKKDKSTLNKVNKLNEYLYRSGKQHVDNEVVDWFHTVGKAALFVQSKDDEDIPVEVYALDPRSAFVVYSLNPGNKPVMGVNMVVTGENTVKYDVFTPDFVYRITGAEVPHLSTDGAMYIGATSLDSVEVNTLGLIPIVEYQYNSTRSSAFEAIIPLQDAINTIMSNRVDGVEQFIQSLAVATNCNFEEGTTANSIRQAGMIVLKSIGEHKADFKILSEQLNQSESQVLVDYLYQQILTISAIPNTRKGIGSTSDTGVAVLARDGWFMADTSARDTEDLFRRSNRYFDEIFLKILTEKKLINISLTDFDIQFVRNETANIISKAQAYHTLMSGGLHPLLALAKSGVSNDPQSDFEMSKDYIELRWGDPEKEEPEPAKVEIREEQRTDEIPAENGEEQINVTNEIRRTERLTNSGSSEVSEGV